MIRYCISGLTIGMIAPEWVLHDNLKTFLCQTGDADVCCSVIFKKHINMLGEKANLIVKTSAILIYESEGFIHSFYDEKDIPYYAVASEDWSVCTMFVDPEYNDPDDEKIVQIVRDGLFAALRDVMIAALAQKRGLIIHSSTIIWNDMGVAFSAPSGAGKSTHTNLWKKMYGVWVLDGDAAACRIVNGVSIVYGLPWCGTSGEFINHSVPLRAIVFLQQAKENRIEKLDFHEAFIRLAARCFLQPWNDRMTNQFLDIIHEVAACTDCYLLNCLPDNDAVEMVKNCLGKN